MARSAAERRRASAAACGGAECRQAESGQRARVGSDERTTAAPGGAGVSKQEAACPMCTLLNGVPGDMVAGLVECAACGTRYRPSALAVQSSMTGAGTDHHDASPAAPSRPKAAAGTDHHGASSAAPSSPSGSCHMHGHPVAAPSGRQPQKRKRESATDPSAERGWTCRRCTLVNPSLAPICAACESRRQ